MSVVYKYPITHHPHAGRVVRVEMPRAALNTLAEAIYADQTPCETVK